jgi:uroporphyrinogen-III synthase
MDLQQKVLIVSSTPYDAFAARLHDAGYATIGVSTFEETDDWSAFDAALEAVSVYTGIVIPDDGVMQFFVKRCEELQIIPSELPRMWCSSPGDVDIARQIGINAHTLPDAASAGHIADVFGSCNNQYFLLVTCMDRHEALVQEFSSRGGRLNVVPVMSMRTASHAQMLAVDDMLIGGEIDCIAFFGAGDIRRFTEMIPSFRQGTVLCAVPDLMTATTLMAAGLRADIVADVPGQEAYAGSVIERLRSDAGIEYNPGELTELA